MPTEVILVIQATFVFFCCKNKKDQAKAPFHPNFKTMSDYKFDINPVQDVL